MRSLVRSWVILSVVLQLVGVGSASQNGIIVPGSGVSGADVAVPTGGPWQEFSFTAAGIPAKGCSPADPAGLGCGPSSAGNSEPAGSPPWTLICPANGCILTVTDAFLGGDVFDVFDFGGLIGSTSAVPATSTDCGDNPDVCVLDPTVSHAVFFLTPGPHSITITPTVSPFGGGAAYFRVDAEGPASNLWIGLKNGDDQGTQFDLRVELFKNGTPVADGLKRCITGVTRNPASATEGIVPWSAPVTLASGDVLTLRVSTRIGTNPNDTKCPGPGGSHNSAAGLRLYYDSPSRPSRFDTNSEDLYLRSDGSACPAGGGESHGVTTRFLDPNRPTVASAKCKDSSSVNFAGGNPFKVIGIWSMTLP